MNRQQEAIYQRALRSKNPEAVLNVARIFENQGEPMIADILRRLADKLWGKRHNVGFGIDYKQIQQILNENGASPALVIDGKWGPKSVAAMKAFQEDYDLTATGQPTAETLAVMGLTGTPTGTPSSVPSVAAGAGNMYAQAQTRLNELGASPALKVDGIWGAKSKEALMAFQRKNPSLTVDGILGPKSCAALGIAYSGTSGGTATPGGAADVAAYKIAKSANATLNLTEAEMQYVLAVARGEGFYGNGWAPSAATKELSAQFGLTGSEGVGSNNWGAEQGSGDAGSFPHVDKHADGSAYVANYKKWSTPEKGYSSIAKTVLSGLLRGADGAKEIRDAINRGNLHDAVYAQRANGYFELAADKYLAAVVKNYNALSNATGWPKLLSETGAAAVAGGAGIIIAIVAGGFFLLKKLILKH